MSKSFIRIFMVIIMSIMVVSGCGRQQVDKTIDSSLMDNTETGDGIVPSPSPTSTLLPSATSNTIVPTEEVSDEKEYKTYSWEEIDDMIKDRYDIADPLILELKYWMKQLDEEYTPEKLVKAAKYRNIATHSGSKEENEEVGHTDWNRETPNAINHIKEHPFIPITSGMTGDFIVLTAIVQPIGDEYQEFYGVMNDIRNSSDEVEFLKGLNDLGYYAVDIYVEDLLDLDRRIPCNGIKLYNDYATNMKEIYDGIIQMPENNELKQYLDKYDRQINFSNELKNKEWNLFLFNKRDVQPAIISLHIRSYSTKGGIGLRQKIYYGD